MHQNENLEIVREALKMVTQDPRGTARKHVRGIQFNVAGKTGTAESGSGKSHARFTGYTINEANTNKPDIAIAVIVENIGEGSDYAVPIFRVMVETFTSAARNGRHPTDALAIHPTHPLQPVAGSLCHS